MIKRTVIVVIITLLVLIVFGFIENTITGNVIKEQEKTIIYFPPIQDIPNKEQGRLVFEFTFPEAYFKVGNKSADLLMFFDSVNIQGLRVAYDQKERMIYGGIPTLTAEANLLDGKTHKLEYMFHKTQKKQALILDGKLLVEGEYNEASGQEMITGFAVYKKTKWVESPISIKFSYE